MALFWEIYKLINVKSLKQCCQQFFILLASLYLLARDAKNSNLLALHRGRFSRLCLQQATLRDEMMSPLGQRARFITTCYKTTRSSNTVFSYNGANGRCRHAPRLMLHDLPEKRGQANDANVVLMSFALLSVIKSFFSDPELSCVLPAFAK